MHNTILFKPILLVSLSSRSNNNEYRNLTLKASHKCDVDHISDIAWSFALFGCSFFLNVELQTVVTSIRFVCIPSLYQLNLSCCVSFAWKKVIEHPRTLAMSAFPISELAYLDDALPQ